MLWSRPKSEKLGNELPQIKQDAIVTIIAEEFLVETNLAIAFRRSKRRLQHRAIVAL